MCGCRTLMLTIMMTRNMTDGHLILAKATRMKTATAFLCGRIMVLTQIDIFIHCGILALIQQYACVDCIVSAVHVCCFFVVQFRFHFLFVYKFCHLKFCLQV